MLRFRSAVRFAVAAVWAVSAAVPAGAAAIYVSNVKIGAYATVTLSGAAIGGTETIKYAGQQIETANIGTSANPAASFTLDAWCVDLDHVIYLGSKDQYQTGSLSQVVSLPAVNWTETNQSEMIWLAYYGNQQLANYSAKDRTTFGTKSEFAAAVQVAIWNTEYGTTYSGSDSKIADDLVSLSQFWRQGSPADPAQGGSAVALISTALPQTQELLTYVTAAQAAPLVAAVPEPTQIGILASGAVGLFYARRRLQRRSR